MSDDPQSFSALAFTRTFLTSLCGREFSVAERKAFIKALGLLDADEKHRSLRVHEVKDDLAGLWSVSASESLRMTFLRTAGGRKTMLSCSRHYRTLP